MTGAYQDPLTQYLQGRNDVSIVRQSDTPIIWGAIRGHIAGALGVSYGLLQAVETPYHNVYLHIAPATATPLAKLDDFILSLIDGFQNQTKLEARVERQQTMIGERTFDLPRFHYELQVGTLSFSYPVSNIVVEGKDENITTSRALDQNQESHIATHPVHAISSVICSPSQEVTRAIIAGKMKYHRHLPKGEFGYLLTDLMQHHPENKVSVYRKLTCEEC